MDEILIDISSLYLSFGKKELFSDVNLLLRKGELVALIGENGSGKTSLVKVLSGNIEPNKGSVFIADRNIHSLTPFELAHCISVVYTSPVSVMNMKVFDVVAIGRTPYLNSLGTLNQKDREEIIKALESVGVLHLLDKDLVTLSDGERQRVMIAKALAQDTPIILLDEPTAHLDVKNRVLLLKLLRDLAVITSKAILISTHELEVALKLADTIWLVHERNIIEGSPEDLALNGFIETVFQSKDVLFNCQKGTFDICFDTLFAVKLIGASSKERYWVQNALHKIGYRVEDDADEILEIE